MVQGVVQVGERHQGLDREQHRSDLQGWRPLVLEDIEADSAKLVNVGVVDLGSEEDLGWNHGVLLGQEELAVKDSALVRGLGRAGNLNEEVSGILLVWLSIDSYNWVLSKSLGLLHTTNQLLEQVNSLF